MEVSTEEFDHIASNSQDTILVKFWATWCGPCKAYAPAFQQFSEENSDIKCLSVDCGQYRDLAERFEVMSIPATLVIQNGNVVRSKTGKLTIDQLNELARG
jgi:thioredoxin 1